MFLNITSRILAVSIVFWTTVDAAEQKAAFLGARLGDAADVDTKGAVVEEVLPDTAAANAKLLAKDLITSLDAFRVENADMLIKRIGALSAGTQAVFTIIRDGKEEKIPVTFGARPNYNPLLVQNDPPRVAGGTIQSDGLTFGDNVVAGGNTIVDTGGMIVEGDFEQTWTGLLQIAIEQRDGRSVVDVAGNVTPSGILYIRMSGITPRVHDRFELIRNAKSLTGQFGKVLLPKLDNDLKWQVVYDDLTNGSDLDGDGKCDVTLVVIDESKKEGRP